MWPPSHVRRLAVRRLTGHSAPTVLLTDAHRSRREHFETARRVPDPATAQILEDLPMPDAVKVGFVPFSTAPRGVLVVFCDDTLKFGAATRKRLGAAADLVRRAADTNRFKGKSGSTLDLLAPKGLKVSRLIVVGAE